MRIQASRQFPNASSTGSDFLQRIAGKLNDAGAPLKLIDGQSGERRPGAARRQLVIGPRR